MVRPTLSDSYSADLSVRDGNLEPIADYLETIAILQDEVARLEHELQLRDVTEPETSSIAAATLHDESSAASTAPNVAGESAEVEQFEVQLASRDETIRLLLDELIRIEEVQAATRAEWEQLAAWVAELEHRVEGQDEEALHELEKQLAAQQQKLDTMRIKSEQDRRAWKGQQQLYQAEIARLQETLFQAVNSPESQGAHEGRVAQGPEADANRVEVLQAENLRLRAAWQELVERSPPADRFESYDAKLADALNEQYELRRKLEQTQDETKRERLEYQASLAELRAQLSQASLIKPVEPPPEQAVTDISPDQDIELRIRALRQHLVETDQREEDERRQKRLISRLSRLWSRTGPR